MSTKNSLIGSPCCTDNFVFYEISAKFATFFRNDFFVRSILNVERNNRLALKTKLSLVSERKERRKAIEN